MDNIIAETSLNEMFEMFGSFRTPLSNEKKMVDLLEEERKRETERKKPTSV